MEQQSLFERADASPLAVRMRPQTLDEFVGQKHLLGPGKVLRRLIESDRVSSMIFWGPPGVGKTSLARVIGIGEVIRAAQDITTQRALLWPLFYTGVFYLLFNGGLTLLFGWAEKKLNYYKG